MKIGRVIGKVVLSQSVYTRGARWLLVSPIDREGLENIDTPRISPLPSGVVFDKLGAQEGDLIAIADGGEAMRPFDYPMPIDSYSTAILDRIDYRPASQ